MQNIEIVVERSGRFDYVYEVRTSGENHESESYFYERILVKQLIVPGYLLYEVRATYARWLKPNKYYVAATNKQEARRRFQNRHTWLNVIKSISLLSAEETEVIVNEPRKHLIF